MNSEFAGILFGVVIGLILCVIIFIACNKDRRIKSVYDERQEAIKGKSYKLGFYVTVCYLAFLTVFFMGDFEIPFTLPVLAFLGLAIGVTSVAVHSIWNGAYWGMNNIKTRYIVVMVVCAIINLGAGINGIIYSNIFLGHQPTLINLICGIMLLIIGAMSLIRKLVKSDSDAEEEDE